jgi:hypothetical protein
MKTTLCAMVLVALTLFAEESPTVTITGGPLRGSAFGSGAVFKGIPFAAPPVGNLRWREPALCTGLQPAPSPVKWLT